MQPADIPFVPLTDAAIATYVDALISAWPRKMSVEVTWRTRGVGALIPAGVPAVWSGEVWDVERPEGLDGRAVLQMFFPDLQIPGQPTLVSELPNRDCEYSVIKIIASKSLMMGTPLKQATAPAPATTTLPEVQKRQREEELDMQADALRGEVRKRLIAPNLKVPIEIADQYCVLFPHLWLTDPPAADPVTAYQLAFADWQLSQNIRFDNEGKRAEFFSCRQQMLGWLSATKTIPTDKLNWFLPFSIAAKLLSLFAFSRGGYAEESKAFATATVQFENGFVNHSATIALFTPSGSRGRGRGDKGDGDDGGTHHFRSGFRGWRGGRGRGRGNIRGR
jgi:hypothetical protein